MGSSVQMKANGPGTKGLVGLNHHMRDEQRKINEGVEDLMYGCTEVAQAQAVPQRQQQSRGPAVHWERFLPCRSLKVLLVENDNSTRHVVSALLRNCSYEVTAVENGLQAWKILGDLTTHIDLVLTEVVMPCSSGIGLLCKIMSHKTWKNIPVIMMSSHDSMGTVFKCFSKGAVDFLVKPIRKNELKNLWQHVWRKCHSQSSGSGSESGIWTQKSANSKSVEESDNNTGSNDENDNGSIDLNVRNGSDNGSGTQSSGSGSESGIQTQKSANSKSVEELDNDTGSNDENDNGSIDLNVRDGSGTQIYRTKRAVEVDSSQPMTHWDQLADPRDSTCAQVMHSRLEAFGSNWVPMTATRECQGQNDELDNIAMGKDLEIGVSRNLDLQLGNQSEKVLLTNVVGTNKDKFPQLGSKKDGKMLEKGQMELNSVKPNVELRNQAADLMGVIANSTGPQIESVVFELPHGLSKMSVIKDNAIYETKEMPSLELSLSRLRDIEDTGTSADDRNVLRHSDLSAISRCNTTKTANQAPTGNVSSWSPFDNSSEAAKTESMRNFQSNSDGTPPNQCSNGSSNSNDMGFTAKNVFTKPAAFIDKPAPTPTVKCLHLSSAFKPVENGHISLPRAITPGTADAATVSTVLTPGKADAARGMHKQDQVQHHHHHYHHHHHHIHKMQQQQQPSNHDDLSLEIMEAVAPQSGSSDVLSAPIEGNAANYSLNGSASGSDQGSNRQNGSSTAVNTEGTNMESDNGVAGKGGPGGGSGSRIGVDQNRFAQREAALNKFRQKRKERCFEKKVRYQGRKTLAEQRPRIRGQFVRQVVYKNKSEDPYC